jgi:hypothetical protein
MVPATAGEELWAAAMAAARLADDDISRTLTVIPKTVGIIWSFQAYRDEYETENDAGWSDEFVVAPFQDPAHPDVLVNNFASYIFIFKKKIKKSRNQKPWGFCSFTPRHIPGTLSSHCRASECRWGFQRRHHRHISGELCLA